MEEGGAQSVKLGEYLRQSLFHVFGRHSPAVSRNPDRTQVSVVGKYLGSGGLEEEHRSDPRSGKDSMASVEPVKSSP